jgi:hypothetical protein
MSETQVESAASARTIRCASVSAAKGTELVKGLCAAGVARGQDTRQGTPRRAAVAALMRRAVDDDQRRCFEARHASQPSSASPPSTPVLEPRPERATVHDEPEAAGAESVDVAAVGGVLDGAGVVTVGGLVVVGGVAVRGGSGGPSCSTHRAAVSQIPSRHVPSGAQVPVTRRPGPR